MKLLSGLGCYFNRHKMNETHANRIQFYVPTDVSAMTDKVVVRYATASMCLQHLRCGECNRNYTVVKDFERRPGGSVSIARPEKQGRSGYPFELTAINTIGNFFNLMEMGPYEEIIKVEPYTVFSPERAKVALDWVVSMAKTIEQAGKEPTLTEKLYQRILAADRQTKMLVDSALNDPHGRFECIDLLDVRP